MMFRTCPSNVIRGAQIPSSLSNNATIMNSNALSKEQDMNMSNRPALDSLPKQFVLSMKKLFDILDDQHCGFVRLADIEKGWRDDGCKGLPRGVLGSLRKVTPPNGLLSFERFCAGLKLCLLRNQQVTPFEPGMNIQDSTFPISNDISNAMICGSHAATMSQLSPDSEQEVDFCNPMRDAYLRPQAPPKPPRAVIMQDSDKTRNKLQSWQMDMLLNEMELKDKSSRAANTYVTSERSPFDYRGSADGGSSSATESTPGAVALHVRKSSKREPRRHTLQNGVDYNMLKRLKHFEEERELLLLGLDGIEKALDWYMQQILRVQDKIQQLSHMGSHTEQWSEVQQEQLNFQRARVIEANRNLANLTETWSKGGLPYHINLAVRTPSKVAIGDQSYCDRNSILNDNVRHQFRKEINRKNERITLLEREKLAMCEELFELKQRFGLTRSTRSGVPDLVEASPISQSSNGLDDADVVY